MSSFLNGVLWAFIIIVMIGASLHGHWWLFPVATFVGWIADLAIKAISQGGERRWKQ